MPQKIINTFKSLGLGLSLETCDIFFESLGIGIEKFGLGKKVSVSVLKNLVSEKKSRKKVLVSVSKNLVSEKKSRSRYWKIWSRKKSLGIGLGNFGLG